VLEDAGAQAVPGWATGVSPGPANESGQTITFTVGNDNPGLFSAQPTVAPNGTLTYRPAANANGAATVTVTATDSGGTADGGHDTSPAQFFTITVTPVNDPPSFTAGADQTVLEDAGAQTVAGWATAISPGPTNESSQTVTFAVGTTNPGLFSAQPEVLPNGTLTYRPAANANGAVTVTVRAVDSGGTANGGDDTSPAQTFTLTVTAVNDPPSFTAGADQTVLEDAAAQTVAGWATVISPGAANETGQTVTFAINSDNPGLFSNQPSIAVNGTLTYRPAADANGTATVTVTATDNGGTANGGNETSGAQTFTITVTAVNDPPSFTAGPNQTVLEGAGPQAVAAWATAINPGPANESGQAVTFALSSDNPSLFDTAGSPTVGADGTLSYTPATDQYGTAVVSVSGVDNGGSLNGGNDTSPAQSFTITVQPAPPVAADDAYSTPLGTALGVNAPGLLANDADVNGSPLALQTTPVSGPGNGSVALNADGSFIYTPNLAFVGTDSFTYRMTDGLGLSSTATATITVSTSLVAPDTLYLGTTGPSADVWTMDTTFPPAATPVPDYDGDGKDGLTIRESDGKETISDPAKQQYWTYTVPGLLPLILNGPVKLDLYSVAQNFELNQRIEAFIYLYHCDSSGANCVKLTQNSILLTPWNTVSSFDHQTLTIGAVPLTAIPAGDQLKVRLLVKNKPVWVAMTAAFPSALTLTLGP
jgi:hypothetical protein